MELNYKRCFSIYRLCPFFYGSTFSRGVYVHFCDFFLYPANYLRFLNVLFGKMHREVKVAGPELFRGRFFDISDEDIIIMVRGMLTERTRGI